MATAKKKKRNRTAVERDFRKIEKRVCALAESIFEEAPTWRVDLVENPGENLGEFHERFILARTYSYRVTALLGEVQQLRRGVGRVLGALRKRYGDRVRELFKQEDIRKAKSDELRKRMVEAEAATEKGYLELFEPLEEDLERLYWFVHHCHKELGEARFDLGSQLRVIRHQIITGELQTAIPLHTIEQVLSGARRGDAVAGGAPPKAERPKRKKTTKKNKRHSRGRKKTRRGTVRPL